jgi:integrase
MIVGGRPKKPKGFRIIEGRHKNGKLYCYHRKSGEPVDLQKYPLWSAEFYAECARINALVKAITPKPGTLGVLIQAYKSHEAFSDLEPRTRADYQRVFDYLKPIADTPLVKFTRGLVVRIRDKAVKDRGRRQGNYVKTVLSLLFKWGFEREYLDSNPALGITDVPRKKGSPDANPPWSDEARHVVLERAPAHLLLPLGIMMFTALGPKDALTLPRSFLKGNEVATRRAKTGEPVFWPCPTPLLEIIRNAPKHDAVTLCANSRGRPWTVSGFNSSWEKLKRKLEKEGAIGPGLTLYGLRHTVAVILREIGYDDRTIADALGQAEPKMALHYAKGADLKPKMRGVVKNFDEELDKRKTKTVKPPE